ncbi:MAG: formate dehydrogenase subunit gamma [Alphaproteobacteria bacterium]|jgi:hypothetical protein|nr:formate dehydrogenase subunit gamma [Alphaproteobacteria bacterium]
MKVAAVCFAVLAAAFVAPPAAAQQPAPNPNAQSANEQQLLQELWKIEGRVSIPDSRAAILEQPQGREYQQFHERVLPWLRAIVIIGAIVALAVFYLIRGPITLDNPPTGIKIKRFSPFEWFNHWLTATSFIVLAITGLNYVFGKRLLMPLMGPDAFAAWSMGETRPQCVRRAVSARPPGDARDLDSGQYPGPLRPRMAQAVRRVSVTPASACAPLQRRPENHLPA